MNITILDHFKESLWQSEDKRYIVEQGGQGSGKAVPLDTKVITPDGYKLMGDIKIGDYVCNTYGGVSQVLNKWDNTSRRIYKITFEDGREIKCADNHQWLFQGSDGQFIEGNTRDLANEFRIGDVYLPLPKPVFFENPPSDVLPVLLGILLGLYRDIKQEDISNISKDDLLKYGIIKENGKVVSNIPKRYMRMSYKDRVQFLSGLFGTCGEFHEETQTITLQIKSQPIAKRVRSIIWSLGGICEMRYSYLNGKYNLKFNFADESIKEDILYEQIETHEIDYVQRTLPIGLKVTSITYCGEERCQCIQVDQIDHLYLIDDYIVTHNSAQICQRFCYLFLTRDDMAFAVVRSTMPALTRSVYLGDPSIYKTLSDWGIPITSWLNKTEATIRNPINGSVMYFIGLDDPEKIKSMNLNYVFIEEATEINADKWAQLNTRLRRYNPYGKNQMYIAYNPISYYNWVVQMFVANPDPLIKEDSVVHFSNFTQNPYVSLENVRGWFARAQQDENYYRTYIIGMPGQPLGLIYPNIHFTPHSTWPNEVWEQKPYYGIDWGFIDPMVLVECRDYDGKIYVICKYYKTKTNTKEFLKFMEDSKISKVQNIYYDSADAERGNLLLNQGYTGFKAKKDINAGISYVKGFDIIVDSQGEFAQDAMDEIKSYAWQTDPDDSSKFIEKPEEGNDHFCLIGETLITTDRGEVPIKDIKVGDFVLTRAGYKRVIDWQITQHNQPINKLTTQSGKVLYCTPNHKIFSNDSYIQERYLSYGDVLLELKKQSSMEKFGEDTPILQDSQTEGIIETTQHICTEQCGNITSVQYQKDIISTISMEITPTTTYLTQKQSKEASTSECICQTYQKREDNNSTLLQIKQDAQHQNGTGLKRVRLGILSIVKKLSPIWKSRRMCVSTVEKNTKASHWDNIASVQIRAEAQAEETQVQIMKLEDAQFVGRNSQSTSTMQPNVVQGAVLENLEGVGVATVYNITIEDQHEYFANGILVSNCDQLRYQIVTDHMYNRNYGVASLDFDSINDRLRKSGIYFPDDAENQNQGGGGVGQPPTKKVAMTTY